MASNYNIWVFDHIDKDLNFLDSTFKQLDLNVKTFSSIETLQEMASQFIPNLCVIDIDFNGNDTTIVKNIIKELKQRSFKEVPIFITSKIKSKSLIGEFLEIGASEFIEKPFDTVTLEYLISRYFADVKLNYSFGLGKVTQGQGDCFVNQNFMISEVYEDHIIISSKVLVFHGAKLKFKGSAVEEMFGSQTLVGFVRLVSKEDTNSDYRIKVEFPTATKESLIHLACWIRDNTKIA